MSSKIADMRIADMRRCDAAAALFNSHGAKLLRMGEVLALSFTST